MVGNRYFWPRRLPLVFGFPPVPVEGASGRPVCWVRKGRDAGFAPGLRRPSWERPVPTGW